jgi:hypothetical protein
MLVGRPSIGMEENHLDGVIEFVEKEMARS